VFLGGGPPFASEDPSLLLVLCGIHEGNNSDISSVIISILLVLDEMTKVLILNHVVAFKDVDKKAIGGFASSLEGDDLCLHVDVELCDVGVKGAHCGIQLG
jgi:hypothetical protein